MALKTSDTGRVVVSGSMVEEVVVDDKSNLTSIGEIKIKKQVETIVEEIHGLSLTAAQDITAANRSSTLVDKRIVVVDGPTTYWWDVSAGVGVKKNANYQKQGNSRMYTVTITTETHTLHTNKGEIQ